MPSIKKSILTPSHIDPAMKWLDGQATRVLNAGKVPWLMIGYDSEEDDVEELRTDLQRSKTHAMINDIAKQAVFKTPGLTVVMSNYDTEEAKALVVRWFERECAQLGEPLRHGSRIVVDPFTGEQITIRASTIKFLKKETINFVEWLYSTGADGNVKWSEKALKEYESYQEMQRGR